MTKGHGQPKIGHANHLNATRKYAYYLDFSLIEQDCRTHYFFCCGESLRQSRADERDCFMFLSLEGPTKHRADSEGRKEIRRNRSRGNSDFFILHT